MWRAVYDVSFLQRQFVLHFHVGMYICIIICTHAFNKRGIYIYPYIYMCLSYIHVYTYIYIYIYICSMCGLFGDGVGSAPILGVHVAAV